MIGGCEDVKEVFIELPEGLDIAANGQWLVLLAGNGVIITQTRIFVKKRAERLHVFGNVLFFAFSISSSTCLFRIVKNLEDGNSDTTGWNLVINPGARWARYSC